jgi:hypothetical protein
MKVGDQLYSGPRLESEMHKDSPFTFDISIDAPDIVECEPALKTLKGMRNMVSATVDKLAPLLP